MGDRRNGELGVGMIEHYDVRGLIGRSEWSAVYDALDVPAGQRVALRVLSVPDACAARARLSLSSVVSHPNVIQLRGVREREDDWLVAAELGVYGSFAEFLKRSGRVDPELAVHIVTDAARGLAAAHERGMVHGAVRPSNIVFTEEGSKLCDLGFREIRESILAAKGVPLPLEALAYQAPEVVGAGQPTSPLSDLYSLGATLYHLLSGVPPFAGETPPELVFRIVCETVKPLAECCPVPLPALLCGVVLRLLSKDPSERYPSAEELIADLEQVASQWKAGRAHVAPRPAARDMAAVALRPAARDMAAQCDMSGNEGAEEGESPVERPEARDMAIQIEVDEEEDALEDDAPDVQLGTQDMMAQADMGGDEDTEEDDAPIVQPGARDIAMQAEVSEEEDAAESDSSGMCPLDENVQFTVYRPKRVAPMKWAPLLAFAHLSSRPPDAPDDEPDPIEEVKKQAAAVLGDAAEDYQNLAQDSRRAVPREGEITFVPTMEGVQFNPPSRTVLWVESVHREEFKMRAAASLNGRTARGRMTVFLGSIILAEIDLAIPVSDAVQEPVSPASLTPASAQPYHDIFASYSHADEAIVLEYERFVESLGHKYLRDCVNLRAGQEWSHELENLIERADVFQLFWSSNSMRSPFVEQEWRYALSLPRRQFIRPTYWEDPLPELPERGVPTDELRRLHFHFIGRTAPPAHLAPASVDAESARRDRPKDKAPPDAGDILWASRRHIPCADERSGPSPESPDDDDDEIELYDGIPMPSFEDPEERVDASGDEDVIALELGDPSDDEDDTGTKCLPPEAGDRSAVVLDEAMDDGPWMGDLMSSPVDADEGRISGSEDRRREPEDELEEAIDLPGGVRPVAYCPSPMDFAADEAPLPDLEGYEPPSRASGKKLLLVIAGVLAAVGASVGLLYLGLRLLASK